MCDEVVPENGLGGLQPRGRRLRNREVEDYGSSEPCRHL